MTKSDANAVLNRLLAILNRSLPMYLADAVPWCHPGDEQAKLALALLVTDYRHYVGRLTEMLLSRRQLIDFGDFPMAFTDTHDLSLDYLLSELIYYQKQDIAAIGQCIAALAGDPAAHSLAEEISGNASGHLEALEELATQSTSAPAAGS
ncbi:MAG TPA: hypothetical protein VGJ15_00410 [Pirellulales bacterium]